MVHWPKSWAMPPPQPWGHDSICLIILASLTASPSHTPGFCRQLRNCVQQPIFCKHLVPDRAGRALTQPKPPRQGSKCSQGWEQPGQSTPVPLHRQLPSPSVPSLLQMCTEEIWLFVLQTCLGNAGGILTQHSLQSEWKLKLFIEPVVFFLFL